MPSTTAAGESQKSGEFEVDADGVRVMRGDDRVVATPRLPPLRGDGAASTFKFEDAPITEVVHVMLGEKLKVDYV